MWSRKRSDLDQREEVQSHIRIEADRLEAAGTPREDALAFARARFGYTPHLDPVDSTFRPNWLENLARDIRYATRRLIASPISTATILTSLVVGIGVNTAIFSLADQALIRSMPVEAPDELVQLAWEGRFVGGGRGFGDLIPHPMYVDLRADQEVFQEIAARSPGEVTLVIGGRSERAQVELVTGSYFRMLGVRPLVGRFFSEDDDVALDAHPIIVLSHAYWVSRFGADSTVIGRQVHVNARSMTVVGVAPPGFHGTDWSVTPAVWVPMMMNDLVHEWGRLSERRVRFQHVFARLSPGVTREQAEIALQGWFQQYIRADIQREGWPGGVEASDMEQYLASRLRIRPGGQGQAARGGDFRQPMLILSAATAFLLLLACLNVANLLVAKAVARHRDLAVRTALGASRGRVMMERLVEAGLVVGVGGGLGVALAPPVSSWILSYLRVGGSEMALRAQLDGRALVAALVISLIATIVSGVGPAWFAASARPMGALGTRGGTSMGGLGLRQALVVGQMSLAVVLLIGAGLFGRTLGSLRSEGPGFASERLLVFTLTPTNDGYEDLESKRVLLRILDEVQSLPNVSAAGMAIWPILEGGGWGNTVVVEGARRFETDEALPMNAVSPGFFAALGVPVTLGRDFDSRDILDEDGWRIRSAIVSEAFVERYLPGEYPIGARVGFGREPWRTEIVGVVRGYHEHTIRDSEPQVFLPVWERPAGTGTFYVRSSPDCPDDPLTPPVGPYENRPGGSRDEAHAVGHPSFASHQTMRPEPVGHINLRPAQGMESPGRPRADRRSMAIQEPKDPVVICVDPVHHLHAGISDALEHRRAGRVHHRQEDVGGGGSGPIQGFPKLELQIVPWIPFVNRQMLQAGSRKGGIDVQLDGPAQVVAPGIEGNARHRGHLHPILFWRRNLQKGFTGPIPSLLKQASEYPTRFFRRDPVPVFPGRALGLEVSGVPHPIQ
ncbi:ABC transporter permease [Gemmatimonadota bacterium]